ncbi:oligosaccharide flippase family protein [Methylicorpusculum oleiharenae]|nr:oligosaccharide flippase family protein [Methylicorpusculum oleiharenae]
MAVSLYTSRIVLNTLGVEDFGIYNVVGGFVTLFGFLNSSMASGTQRFLSFEIGQKDFTQLAKVFSMCVNIHFIIALVILILAETIGLWAVNTQLTLPTERMEATLWVYQFSILAFLVNVVSVPYNAAIIAHERMNVFAWVSIIDVGLKLLIVFMLQWFGFDKLKLYAVLMFSIALIIRIIYGIYCRRNFPESRFRFFWDKPLFKTLMGFAAWNLWGNVAFAMYSQGINILLNIFFGPAVNAARGIAYQVQGSVNGFVHNFQMAMNPQITKSFAANDLQYMHQLIFQGAKYSFYLLFLLSLPILLETEIILELWLNTVPDYTIIFTQLVIVNILIESISGPLMTAAQASGKIKLYQSIVGGLLISILPISYVFLKQGYPPEVTIYINIIVSVIALIFRLIIVSHLVRLSVTGYLVKVVLRVFSVTIFSIIPPLLMHTILLPGFQRLLVVGIYSTISALLVIYVVGFKNNERIFIKNKLTYLLKLKTGKI